jgi:uncharacterized protein YggT (Ycf19 family)
MNAILYQILYYGYLALYFYYFVMVLQILLSWTPIIRTRFYDLIVKITSPYMNLFKGWFVLGHLDLTPILGLVLYQLLLAFIGSVL